MTIVLVAQHRLSHPAGPVFDLCTDAQRFPQVFRGYGPIPAIREVVLLAPLAVGSEREIHNSDGSVLRERVTALQPPLHHAYTLSGFRAPFAWLVRSGAADWQLQPLRDATLLTWTYRFETTSAITRPLAAALLHRCMQPAMQRCLRNMDDLLGGANGG
jgi:ribosome-associated toxin RatA of RatAB toxin-antitoxin module